ncbi:hypothetical protein ACFRMQ_22555, partial [Kitasatospora sp. NPDC056783]
AEAADEPEAPAADRSGGDGPRAGRRHDAPAVHPRPKPAPDAGGPSGGQGADAAELCATARTYGGQYLGSLVDLCQRAAAASGKRSLAPGFVVREGSAARSE